MALPLPGVAVVLAQKRKLKRVSLGGTTGFMLAGSILTRGLGFLPPARSQNPQIITPRVLHVKRHFGLFDLVLTKIKKGLQIDFHDPYVQ